MKWQIERVVAITDNVHWKDGFSDPIFYDDLGTQYCVHWDGHWVRRRKQIKVSSICDC